MIEEERRRLRRSRSALIEQILADHYAGTSHGGDKENQGNADKA